MTTRRSSTSAGSKPRSCQVIRPASARPSTARRGQPGRRRTTSAPAASSARHPALAPPRRRRRPAPGGPSSRSPRGTAGSPSLTRVVLAGHSGGVERRHLAQHPHRRAATIGSASTAPVPSPSRRPRSTSGRGRGGRGRRVAPGSTQRCPANSRRDRVGRQRRGDQRGGRRRSRRRGSPGPGGAAAPSMKPASAACSRPPTAASVASGSVGDRARAAQRGARPPRPCGRGSRRRCRCRGR